jgi:DMSO/TMAO reductase YedYZ molybdopterin-dependent catalytic subunit
LTSIVWGPKVWGFGRDLLLPVSSVLPPPLQGLIRNGWRIYTVTSIPHFDPATWKLRIDGLVEQPMELTYADLKALPKAKQTSDFHCVTGWSVPHVHWAGVRFKDILAAAKPLPEARALGFYSADGAYTDSLTWEQAHLPDVMLAYEMDGQPLTRPHGSPARVVIPEMYGYKGTKWVDRIEVRADLLDGFWEQRGYDQNAWLGHSNGYG